MEFTQVALLILLASHGPDAFSAAAAATTEQLASTLDSELCSGNLSECSVTDIGWATDEHLALIQRAAHMMLKGRDSQNAISKEEKRKQIVQHVAFSALDMGMQNDSNTDSAVLMQIASNHTMNQTMMDQGIDKVMEQKRQGARAGVRFKRAEISPPHQKAKLTEIVAITVFPAIAMAAGSTAIYLGRPPEMLQLRLQHLSAGLLIGACLTNIFPIMQQQLIGTTGVLEKKVINWYNVWASIFGFGLGMAVMYGVKSLELGEEDESEDDDDKKGGKERAATGMVDGEVTPHEGTQLRMLFKRLAAQTNSLADGVRTDNIDRELVDQEIHGIQFLVQSACRLTKGADPIDKRNAVSLRFHASELIYDVQHLTKLTPSHSSKMLNRQLKVVAATLKHIHSHAESANFRRWRPIQVWKSPEIKKNSGDDGQLDLPPEITQNNGDDGELQIESFPWALILAVVLDSFVDGMLIGLAASVAIGSGILMAIATAMEMWVLGYAFACSVVQCMRPFRATVVLALPPLAMLGAATATGAGASVVEGTPAFVALVAFALVALLFLVVDELLSEAKEKEESGEWYIGIWLYVGLLASIVLDVVI